MIDRFCWTGAERKVMVDLKMQIHNGCMMRGDYPKAVLASGPVFHIIRCECYRDNTAKRNYFYEGIPLLYLNDPDPKFYLVWGDMNEYPCDFLEERK